MSEQYLARIAMALEAIAMVLEREFPKQVGCTMHDTDEECAESPFECRF